LELIGFLVQKFYAARNLEGTTAPLGSVVRPISCSGTGMTSRTSRRELLSLGVGGLAYASGLSRAPGAKVGAFELEDQFERKHTQASVFAKVPVVFVGGDKRNTGDRIGEWFARLGEGLALYGIADLDDLPFFVPHSSIRSNLRTVSPRLPILLDFSGKVYRPILGFPEGREVVVQVHDAAGRVLARVEGPVSGPGITAVRRAAGAP